jgi:hypothetical protein
MRTKLAALILLLAQPVIAAPCHHYSKWLYPYPQPKCSGVYARTSTPDDKSWYVEIIKLPPSWENQERQNGIEQLKKQMDKNNGDKSNQ